MVPMRTVTITLDPDDYEEYRQLFEYDLKGNHTRTSIETSVNEKADYAGLAVREFFDVLGTHLPYIKYHEADPFALADTELKSFNAKIFKYSDTMLERETTISNNIGLKNFKNNSITNSFDHYYLPGLPKLIYEEYPFLKPDVEESYEYSNDEFYNKFVLPFIRMLHKKFKNPQLRKTLLDYATAFQSFQDPVDYSAYFTIDNEGLLDTFKDKILSFLVVDIFGRIILKNSKLLFKYFNQDEDIDEENYEPYYNFTGFTNLKSIGSLGESSFAFGINDVDTKLLNKLLVHVELVNLSLGVMEGYELYFNTKKKNSLNKDLKINGSNLTKMDNFLKIFTKCVSICLNSKTNRFIISDYYWCGLFEIEDILDSEIVDIKRLISKVKVKHFGFSNFENDPNLTIRNIIGGFFNIKPKDFLDNFKNMEVLNNKVIKEWLEFNNKNDYIVDQRVRKKFKKSSFIFRTETGLEFNKLNVDLDKSLISFIAIGYNWSCQTLSVNLNLLYQDENYLNEILKKNKLSAKDKNEVLLSVYDEYYSDENFSMISRHLKHSKIANVKSIKIAGENYKRWLSNVEAYKKAESLQGDILTKVLDFGYLEDKPYNSKNLHFKTDGYFVIYKPINYNFFKLKSINLKDESHYELAKKSLNKLHEAGVSFSPNCILTGDIFRYFDNKVYIINLEDCSTNVTPMTIKRDLTQLDKMFGKSKDVDIRDIRGKFGFPDYSYDEEVGTEEEYL